MNEMVGKAKRIAVEQDSVDSPIVHELARYTEGLELQVEELKAQVKKEHSDYLQEHHAHYSVELFRTEAEKKLSDALAIYDLVRGERDRLEAELKEKGRLIDEMKRGIEAATGALQNESRQECYRQLVAILGKTERPKHDCSKDHPGQDVYHPDEKRYCECSPVTYQSKPDGNCVKCNLPMKREVSPQKKEWYVGEKVLAPGLPMKSAVVVSIDPNDWVTVKYPDGDTLRWKHWELKEYA